MRLRRCVVVAAMALALGATAPGAARAADEVLVVGDSLEVGTDPYLRRELGAVGVEFDHRTGRPSPEGVGVVRARLRPSHRVVVFDLGTNDDPSQPGRLAASLDAARSLAGDRCLVVATVSRPPLGGVGVGGVNRVVRRFASATPNAQVVDWRAAAVADPTLLSPDGVHPNPGGYALRARLVAGAVRACLGSGGASGGLPAPRDRGARPPHRPAPGRGPAPRSPGRQGPAWAALAGLGPLPALGAVIGRALSRVEAAVQQARAALGVLPEPTLGGSPQGSLER